MDRIGVEKEVDGCADMAAPHRKTLLVYPPTLLMSREINNLQRLLKVLPGELETHCGGTAFAGTQIFAPRGVAISPRLGEEAPAD